MTDQSTTRFDSAEDRQTNPYPQTTVSGRTGDLTPELEGLDVWTDELLAGAGIPVIESPLVSIAGGIGSFVLTDYLRVAGVPTASIRVLSDLDYPWQTYEYLTRV